MKAGYLNGRFGLVAHFVIFFLSISFLLRTLLLLKTWDLASVELLEIAKVYATGLLFDLAFCSHTIVPFVIL